MKWSAAAFLEELKVFTERHKAVNHPLLARVAQVPFTREDYRVFGLQHYFLVGKFTRYLEELLIRAPDSNAKQWLAKVLIDEYGEGSEGKDHAELYREFLAAAGCDPEEELHTPLHPYVVEFVQEHLRIVQEEPFLVGLGAVGPGHEWSIPKMFPLIVKGFFRAGFQESEIQYFVLHMSQDVDHGNWLYEALLKFAASSEAQEQIQRGAVLSLEARARFWDGLQEKIVRWRQPFNVHLRPMEKSFFGQKKVEERSASQWEQRLR